MHGTSSVRVPSLFSWSTARPRPTCWWWMTPGLPLPSTSATKAELSAGTSCEGPHHGVADEVGEADLGPRRPGQLVVQDQPVDLEQPGRHDCARSSPSAPTGWPPCWPRSATPRPAAGRAPRFAASTTDAPEPGPWPPARQEQQLWPTAVSDVAAEGRPPEPARRPGRGAAPVRGPGGSRRRTPASSPQTESGSARKRSYMSSTSHALGPKEPPAPPIWVMGQPYRRRSGHMGGRVASALPMTYPAGLHVLSRPAPGGAASVVFVHGSLDRAESFRRVMRRLPEFGTVAYDRRGYQGSRDAGVTDLSGHVDDLLAIASEVRQGPGPGPVVAVGHSFGGDVVVGAALASPPGPSTRSGPSNHPCPGWVCVATTRVVPAVPGSGPRWPTIPARRQSGSSAA